MESKIAALIQFRYGPVALLWADEKPAGALQFKEGGWGCIMWLFANAAKGRTVVFDRRTFGCLGGGTGLGFGNQYLNWPGGIELFCYFLSTGAAQLGVTREMIKSQREQSVQNILYGERYVKSPELVKKFIEYMPITDIPAKYVVMKPLKDVAPGKETPVSIIFLANPDQISALTVLANYARESVESVIMPFGAGCHSIGIFAYRETESEKPRAVMGLMDLSARENVRKRLGKDLFTFTVPLKMFQEMESNVEESFLGKEMWQEFLAD
ncbi:MAG: DUF169 domain-containing protein [Bacillota bacterium]